jgi:hypothetical protein
MYNNSMREIYLVHGNLIVEASGPPPIEGISSWKALIRENECIPDETDVLAINFKDGKGNEELFKHITDSIKKNYFNKILKAEVPLHDLPLYINWPYKTLEFMDLLKRGLP